MLIFGLKFSEGRADRDTTVDCLSLTVSHPAASTQPVIPVEIETGDTRNMSLHGEVLDSLEIRMCGAPVARSVAQITKVCSESQ